MSDIFMEIVQEKFDRKLKEELDKEVKKEVEKVVEKAVEEAVEKAVEKAVEEATEENTRKVASKTKLTERISLIQKKCAKNKSLSVIADELETDTDELLSLYDIISRNPEKTTDEIYQMFAG